MRITGLFVRRPSCARTSQFYRELVSIVCSESTQRLLHFKLARLQAMCVCGAGQRTAGASAAGRVHVPCSVVQAEAGLAGCARVQTSPRAPQRDLRAECSWPAAAGHAHQTRGNSGERTLYTSPHSAPLGHAAGGTHCGTHVNYLYLDLGHSTKPNPTSRTTPCPGALPRHTRSVHTSPPEIVCGHDSCICANPEHQSSLARQTTCLPTLSKSRHERIQTHKRGTADRPRGNTHAAKGRRAVAPSSAAQALPSGAP